MSICAGLALGSCSTNESRGVSGQEGKNSGGEASGKAKCGTSATRDCTPEVGPNGSVRVGSRVLRVTGVQTAATLGDASVGRVENASGVFVVVSVKITTTNSPHLSLSDEGVRLEGPEGEAYKADSDATRAQHRAAAISKEQEPPAYDDAGSDATIQSKHVFDVPKPIISKGLKVRFNALGSEQVHGYIRLPALAAH